MKNDKQAKPMIYFIYIFTAVIIVTLLFIFFTLKWFIGEKLEVYKMQYHVPLQIIERAYRARDFFYQFQYIKYSDIERFRPLPLNTTVIKDDDHKNWIIKQSAVNLVEDMFKAGCIEVRESDDEVFHPLQKTIDIRIKVYQPEQHEKR